MKIQSKLMLLMFTLVAFFVVVFSVERGIEEKRMVVFLDNDRAEKEIFFDKLMKLQGALIEMLSIDYSFWDDTVKFLETKDQEWARINLDEALTTYKANAICIYKKDFSSVYSVNNISGIEPEELNLSGEALAYLFAHSRFCHFFIKTKLGLMEFYGATIHPSSDVSRESPPRGFFLAGRLWDKAYLESLMKLIGVDIAVDYSLGNSYISVINPKEAVISFVRVIFGWNGKPLAYLYVNAESGELAGFRKTAYWTTILFIVFSLVILAVMGLFLVLWIGRPLGLISTALKREDARYLADLRRSSTEFGEISRLISSFFMQRHALEKNEERLKQIAENAEEWIWEVDNGGLYTYSNQIIENILGYKPEEVVGKKYFYDFFIPEQKEKLKRAALVNLEYKSSFKGFVNANIHKDGRVVYLETNGTPIFDDNGSLLGFRGADRDITERVKSEEALKKNRELLSLELERFRILFELTLSMSSGKKIEDNLQFIVDKMKDFLGVDSSFISLFNKEHTEAYIRVESGIRLEAFKKLCIPVGMGLAGWVLQNRRAYITNDYLTDKNIKHFNDPLISAEGAVSCMAAPIQSRDRDYGVLYVFHRSTRAFSEEELHSVELFAHLATVEMERSETFQSLRETQVQLVQTEKMAAVGQLASGVAHEINNPLTGVLNNVQLIKMEMEIKKDKFTYAELNELLGIVEESALRCMKITQSLLSFSRASKGDFQKLDFNDMIIRVLMLVEHEMKLGNITIEKDLQQGLPFISGDTQLLQQVIFNFISNAKWAIEKKSAEKSGTITIKTGYDSGKGRVYAAVSDDGIGMPKENLAKIFEPFFTTKPVGEGTGLGLSVAYSIVKEHQGAIDVESVIDKGTTFKISFPVIK